MANPDQGHAFLPGYLVWHVGPTWYARSNIHGTPGEAAAAGVSWYVVAWSLPELYDELARGVSHSAPN
ncbi:MAG: hypothetical protein JWL58_7231 [Streptosporangiaceae bacterium]|jgi:hypothetical protein|nr:hypothetical protein [Streptosporangiaceae bacterium]